MNFADLGLSDELLKAVEQAGYTEPTPIQAQAIPSVLMMRDLIGIAQTGTGKTAGFVLPMIDILAHGRRRALMPRSLILEPTRELAAQVAENFEKYGKNHDLKMALLIGGVQMGDQVKALTEGVDVLIATPGRLMDLFERGKILLTGCNLLVIDEADRMLDMGFIPDIETICSKLPANRQTLLFSATMPPPIKKLADKFLSNPKSIEVARPATTNTNIVQHKVKVTSRKKRDVLRHLLQTDNVTTAIVFANRKTTVRDLAKSLKRYGFSAGEIHGDMDQPSRNAELQRFKDGDINILVASDVAARGLDVKGVSHVFNFDTPWHPDDYVHRIGRTGRGGATGRAFTLVSEEDAEAIANVERLTGGPIPVYELSADAAVHDGEDREDRPAERSGRGRRGEAKPDGARPSRRGKADRGDDRRPADPVEAVATDDGLGEDMGDARADRRPRRERDRPARDARPAPSQAQSQPRAEPQAPSHRDRADSSAPGEWNGPVPGFLHVSALPG
ncbi:DEAD/DEAH box helicase [Novosphingobium aerophilum]|uniref:DEAD-box ATP-dependent RNA helicase RhpA n=1 Tax=Novosphingobium aerophilum TaxID=2839843 RepID=A0A7X1KBI1_9SPHN|nr:DEAD/DEAH box helicase [Novosphingobium aerophilum]MBC2651097.1 DEAD/DEAH box helicase [Novosphingobium aerophilum]